MRDFFFHLKTPRGLEGSVVPVSCEGPEEAFMEACRVIPQVAAEILRAGHDPMKCEFVIRNLRGEEMFTVPFSELIRETPAKARH